MTGLIELLEIYPVLESVVRFLNYGDLLNLARTSTLARAITHGLYIESPHIKLIPNTKIRRSIRVGRAQTSLWLHLKSKAQLKCSEANHTKGQSPQGCLLCSMPVCLACIVKNSFQKKDATFQRRFRPMCQSCFSTGNPHAERIHYNGDAPVRVDYSENGICQCTAKEGILCCRCKEHQNEGFLADIPLCAGKGCGIGINGDNIAARICLWCNLILPGPRSVERHRQFYDSRSLFDTEIESHKHQAIKAGPE